MHLRNRLIATTAAVALAVAQVSPSFAGLGNPIFDTPPANDNSLHTATTSFVSTAIANLQAAIISLLGGKLSHVANASGLATLTVYSVPIMRDDIGVIYADTGASCTISGGDGGWQIQPATGHCWQTDISKGAPITLWGAVADDLTDAVPAFGKAMVALGLIGGGTLRVPHTTSCFLLKTSPQSNTGADGKLVGIIPTASVVVPANTSIRGESGACLDRGIATGNLIQLGSPTVDGSNSGAYDLLFKHSVTATGVNASDVSGFNAPNSHIISINCLAGYYTCVGFETNGPYWTKDLFASADGQIAVSAGCGQFGEVADVHLDGFDFAFQHRAAFELCFVGGLTLSHGDTDFSLHSLWAHPGTTIAGTTVAGQQVSAVYATNSYFDYSTDTNLLIDGTQGQITEWAFDPTVWVASAGGTIPTAFASRVVGTIPSSANSDGVFIGGATANIVDNRWFMHVFNNARNGIFYQAGIHNQFGGVTTQNCMNGNNNSGANCSGLVVAGGLTNWSWDGKCGGTTGSNVANPQKYGVNVLPGSSDYYTTRGDCSGNATGAVLDGGTGVHKNFDEVVPGVPWSSFQAAYGAISGSFGSAPTGAFAYRLSGSTVTFSATVSIATNGSAAGSVTISLPILASTGATLSARNQTTGAGLMGVINSGQAQVNVQTLAAGYPGADNTTITVSGSYQAAQP